MPWVKFDDGYMMHPKVLRAGRDGRDLHQACIFYAARELTDGFIPAEAVPIIAAVAGIPDPAEALERCLNATGGRSGKGLIEPADGGYVVHDFLAYQPSRDHVQAVAEVRAEAGSRGGKQKASNLLERGLTGAPSKTLAKIKPVPDPDPVPETLPPVDANASTPPPPARPPKYPAAFEDWWREYPAGHGFSKADAHAAWAKLRPDGDLIAALIAGVRRWKASRRWQEGFVMHPHRWLKSRAWEADIAPWSPDTGPPARASPTGQYRGRPGDELGAVLDDFTDELRDFNARNHVPRRDAQAGAGALPRGSA